MADYPIVQHARKIGKNTRDWNVRDMLSFLRVRYPITTQPTTMLHKKLPSKGRRP